MILLVCFAVTVLVVNSCEGKPAQFKGYPEENRNVNNPNLFEGDMLVDPEVKKIALAGGDISMATASRKRGTTKLHIWPSGRIPYVIEPSVPSIHRDKIEKAMREWENGTCLSFVPYVQNSGDVYMKISGNLPGCFAIVGYIPIPPHLPKKFRGLTLNLGPGCFQHRVFLHELGHVIGFYHEQSRPDRDSYVNILTDNIMRGRDNDFRKYGTRRIDSLGSPYDLKSVMHYGPKTFSKNGQNTIEPVDPNQTLENNENISVTDKQQVNLLYNCV
ncbi:zinc metallo ase nas-15-like [Paramuricea clavata]|uniref:Metalloendopeptidase n=1 Tax=Paramuricea clavata TaxID=317549 RepID=A0A7D9DH54_PARCT|nr:zinc metallo ase nas-15-like [Paramuricea clavata]